MTSLRTRERLVQRLGLFSYWRSSPVDSREFAAIRSALESLEQKVVADELLLIRD